MVVAVLHPVIRYWLVLVVTSSVANAQSASPRTYPIPQPAPFDPIDRSGWPVGLSVDDLRELPECGAELPHTPGAAVTCRPPIVVGSPQWGLGVDWTSGATFGDLPTIGAAQALGVQLDFSVLRNLELGARYELLGIGLPSAPLTAATTELSNQFLGVGKLRVYDDEISRRSWSFGVGVGYALRGNALGGSAPLVRGSIGREIGTYLGERSALTTSVELSYEQSLGAQKLSAILASLRFGFEINVRVPRGLGHPAPVPWRHTTSFDVLAGPFLGFGLTLGLRANSWLSLETSGGFLFGFTRDDKEHGLDNASWSLQTGPRVMLPWPADFALLYLQAQGGAAWIGHDPRGELRAIGTGEIGLRGLVGCGSAIDLGIWLRSNANAGVDITAGGLVLRVILGSGRSAAGGHRDTEECGRGHDLHLATPYVAPPPTVSTGQTYSVDLTPPNITVPNVDLHVGGSIEAPKPQPFVVDVDLGAVLFGMQVRIDPRLVPFDRLRGAGYITVELTGPAEALATFQGQLSATLQRGNLRVDGWSSVATGGSVVHARFTVWPPGTRP